MLINLNLTIDYNPETGEATVVKTDSKKSSPKKASTSKNIKKDLDSNTEPTLFLDVNKYFLNEAAYQMFNFDNLDEIRLDIKYKHIDGKHVPVLGTPEAFGTKSGNKLTKNNTVSFRGKAMEMLSDYGESFILLPHKENLFILNGDKMTNNTDNNEEDIKIPDFSSDDLDNNLDIDFDFSI